MNGDRISSEGLIGGSRSNVVRCAKMPHKLTLLTQSVR
jgi:hypothetical protein